MELVAIGNALLDIVAFVDADFAASLGFHGSTTSHIPSDRLAALVPFLPDPWISAGGGAANTARIARLLGMETTFVGSVGNDSYGQLYRDDLFSLGIHLELGQSSTPTGVFCALIDGSGARTLLVAPGAAPEVAKRVPDYPKRSGAFFYMDGFLASNGDFFQTEAGKARRAGMKVALDLGSLGLVKARRDFFLEVIPRFCDFVFANEDEFIALGDCPVAEGLELFGKGDCAYVVKRAERGALLAHKGRVWESPVRAQIPLDETGAGDAFAAGFLVGLGRGYSPERCLRLGNRVAEEVISVPALRLDPVRIQQADESVAN